MSAFYFGSSDAPLYGFYHTPTGRPPRRAGVVICNPMGREYLRSHRSLKGLAERLSGAGYHVLRFDYHGTGDSSGEGEDILLERWVDDTAEAVEELQAISGVRRIGVVGVRLGGVVAAKTAAERSEVEDLVLWDPVVDGRAYLEALMDDAEPAPAGPGSDRSDHRAASHASGSASRAGTVAPSRPAPAPGGFPLPAPFRRELEKVDLGALETLRARRALLVSSEDKAGYETLEQRLRDLVPEVSREHRPGAEGWDNPGKMGSVVLVPAVVGAIAGFFENA